MNQNLRNAPEFSWARLVAQSKDAVIASIVEYYDRYKHYKKDVLKKDVLLDISKQFASWLIQEANQTYARLLSSTSTDPTFKEFYKCWNDYRSAKRIGINWHIPKLKSKQHHLSPRQAAKALSRAFETSSTCSNPDYSDISLIWAAYSVCMKLVFLHKDPRFVNMGQDDQGIKSSHFDNPIRFKHSNYVKRFIHEWLSSPAVAKKIVEYLNLYEITKISSDHNVTQKYIKLRDELTPKESAQATNGTNNQLTICEFDTDLSKAKNFIMNYINLESEEKKLIFKLHKQACRVYRPDLEQKYIDFRKSLTLSGSDLYEFDSDLPTAKKRIMNYRNFKSEEKKLIFKLHVQLNGFMNNVITFGEAKLNTFWKKEFKLPLSISVFDSTIANILSLYNKLNEATAKLKEATAKLKEASGNNSDITNESMNTVQFKFNDCKNKMTEKINEIFEDTALDVNKHFVCTEDSFDDADIILIAVTAAVKDMNKSYLFNVGCIKFEKIFLSRVYHAVEEYGKPSLESDRERIQKWNKESANVQPIVAKIEKLEKNLSKDKVSSIQMARLAAEKLVLAQYGVVPRLCDLDTDDRKAFFINAMQRNLVKSTKEVYTAINGCCKWWSLKGIIENIRINRYITAICERDKLALGKTDTLFSPEDLLLNRSNAVNDNSLSILTINRNSYCESRGSMDELTAHTPRVVAAIARSLAKSQSLAELQSFDGDASKIMQSQFTTFEELDSNLNATVVEQPTNQHNFQNLSFQ